MFEHFRTILTEWNQRTSERQKLQQSYVVLFVADIFLAGLFSLFNATRSRQLLDVALALIIAFVTNFLIWALLQTFVLSKLPRGNSRSRR